MARPLSAFASSPGYVASDVIGQLTNGVTDFTTLTSAVTATGLSYPTGTALDTVHHRLFVADDNNNRVVVYNLDNNNNLIDHTADYVLGQPDFFTSATRSASQSSLNNPYAALVYDSTNNRLFVSDHQNHRIMVFNLANGITNNMPASYVLGQPDFTTTNGLLTRSGMFYPEGMALDPVHQILFVSDYYNNRVTTYNVAPGTIASGMPASNVLGQPDFTSAGLATSQNGFSHPDAIAFNSATQQLFVGDSTNQRVLVFNLSAGITDHMNASYVFGQSNFTTVNNSVTQNSFSTFILGMGIDTTRNILYAQDDTLNRILVFNLAGGITNNMNASLVLGQANFGASDYTCNTSAILLCDSEGNITVDSVNNRIYVPDADDDRVLVYNFAHFTSPAGALTGGVTGTSYSQALQTVGSQCTLSFTKTSGSLPPGLTLNAATGVISGTPTTPGVYSFELALTDNCGAFGSTTDDPAYSITVSGSSAGSAVTTPAAPNTSFGRSIGSSLLVDIAAATLPIVTLVIVYLYRSQSRCS